MTRSGGRQLLLLCAGLALGCGDSERDTPAGAGSGGGAGQGSTRSGSAGDGAGGSAGNPGASDTAGIQLRLAAPAPSASGLNQLLAFAGGGAVRPGLHSLAYHIYSVQICESLEVSGSGFNQASGCLELYSGDQSVLAYELDGDWTELAEQARASNDGFIDLLDPVSRAGLARTTSLGSEHVRSYHYGIITWSLPIKVSAQVALSDGSLLYTHDGPTRMQTIGADHFRDYFTEPGTALDVAPAEPAVVILGNGGNWFKFQNPLVIRQADLDEKRQWVLDLVFNPEGIVKGFAGDGAERGNVRELSGSSAVRGIMVPMLDLAPVPHRASESVVRESYLGNVTLGGSSFDARIELYSVAGDPNATVYGVDVKSLVTAQTTSVPPELAKISSLRSESDGSLSFLSYRGAPLISGFRRVAAERDTTTATIACATHADREGAEGGAAIVVDSCPAPQIEVTFTLVGRRNLDGDIPLSLGPVDAGAPDAGTAGDAGGDAGAEPSSDAG